MMEPEEPIRILSDLHLGHPASTILDVCAVFPLLEGVRSVIFNGDTSEQKHKRFRVKGDQDLRELRAHCGAKDIQAHFLTGNHDPAITSLNHMELCGGKVLVTHGDVLFRHVSPWSLGYELKRDEIDNLYDRRGGFENLSFEDRLAVVKEASILVRKNPMKHSRQGVRGKLIHVFLNIWPPSRLLSILRTWLSAPRKAFALMERYRPGAAILVHGHMHRRCIARRNNKAVIDTGAFQAFARPSLVDISGGELVVRKVVRRREAFVPGKVLTRFELAEL